MLADYSGSLDHSVIVPDRRREYSGEATKMFRCEAHINIIRNNEMRLGFCYNDADQIRQE